MQNNDRRILGNVVRMDGWITPFTKTGHASVHLDCVFDTVTLGGGSEDLLKVQLALRRAEIYLRTMEGEPFAIVKGSQWAQPPSPIKVHTAKQSKLQAAGSLVLSATGLKSAARGSTTQGTSRTEKQTIFANSVQHLPDTGDGKGPGFAVATTITDGVIDGHAWHHSVKLLKIKRLAKIEDQAQMLVTVRCRYPDLAIDPLPLDEKARLNFLRKRKKDERLVAAEQFLKEELIKLGFLTRSDDLDGHLEFTIGTLTISEGQI